MIRRASVADADTLAVLCNMVQALHVSERGDVFGPTDNDTLAMWFRARLSSDGVRAWIAEHEGTALGYAIAIRNERAATAFTFPMRWVEIEQLGVHPDHQRRGVARALVEAVLADADASGVRDIRIKTWAFNERAQAVFQRLGFRPRAIEYDRS